MITRCTAGPLSRAVFFVALLSLCASGCAVDGESDLAEPVTARVDALAYGGTCTSTSCPACEDPAAIAAAEALASTQPANMTSAMGAGWPGKCSECFQMMIKNGVDPMDAAVMCIFLKQWGCNGLWNMCFTLPTNQQRQACLITYIGLCDRN